ncbi:phage tail protein [Paraliomyxa miuraensis]|uniref:phage tail protein n=1 Tax=Paraliomyxa miuraensis TaxID=376150 RepID=UPI00225804D6|nr:tail fiber protein [Paraliomyxa miuraensis]
MEPFIGQIIMFAGNFAPRGWALCDGQLLPISQNQALFSILGTTYGGDGRTTFALPDLRGRASLHAGSGPGLTPRSLGQKSGEETVTLTVNQMPSHGHVVNAADTMANVRSPSNAVLAQEATGAYQNGRTDVTMNPAMIGNSGGSQPHDNMQPYLVVNYIIALEGIFPSRN